MTINKNNSVVKSKGLIFTISRTFDASKELVWKAFTDPEHLKHWWGPKGYTVRVSNMDFRPGGIYHYCLRSPEGKDIWGRFTYKEIRPFEKIVLVSCFSDENAGVTRHPMSPTWPLLMLSTFTFTEDKGKATLSIQWVPISPTEEESKTFEDGRSSMNQGWTGTLDQLTGYLAKVKDKGADERELAINRILNAPRERVWKAWTVSKQVAHWWGPNGFTNPLCELDVREGGIIRIDMRGPDSTIYPMAGIFNEIVEPERLIFTSAALDKNKKPLFEVRNIVTFIKHNGKTEITLRARVTKMTPEAAPYLKGMNEGWTQSLDRLAKYVESR